MKSENLLASLLFVLLCQSYAQYFVFQEQPHNLNAFNNSNLTFRCAAVNANLYLWYINGNSHTKFDNNVTIGTKTTVENALEISTLTIQPPYDPAKLNESEIYCKAADHANTDSGYGKSEQARLLLQGQLDPPEVTVLDINCTNKSIGIQWIKPFTLDGLFLIGYRVCKERGENCTDLDNTTLNHTTEFPDANVYTCENVSTDVAGITAVGIGLYQTTDYKFTQEPEYLEDNQIDSKVFYSPEDKSFGIQYQTHYEEKDRCHLPETYNISILDDSANNLKNCTTTHANYTSTEGLEQEIFSCMVNGQETHVYSTLEAENCAGVSSSASKKNGLFHVQLTELNGSNITCYFADGSNAQGCETFLTCNMSVSGSTGILNTTCQMIKEEATHGKASGNFNCSQPIYCLTYDISVYDILSNGNTGLTPVKRYTNITIEPSPSLPDTTTHETITSPISSTPGGKQGGPFSFKWILILIAIITPIIILVVAAILLRFCCVKRESGKAKIAAAENHDKKTITVELKAYTADDNIS